MIYGIERRFAQSGHRGQGELHRILTCGIVCTTLLLMAGCGDGAPETPPPPPTPPVTNAPENPPAGTESQPTAPDPATGETPSGTDTTAPKEPAPDESAFDKSLAKPKDDTEKAAGGTDPANPDTTLVSKDLSPFLKIFGSGLSEADIKQMLQMLTSPSRERPKDVSEWELTDFIPAYREKDKKFEIAVWHYTRKQEGKPFFAELITKLLDPEIFNLASATPPGAEGTDPNVDPNVAPVGPGEPLKLDQRTVELFIAALAYNNTSKAAETLRGIVENKKFKVAYPQAATKAALEALAFIEVDRAKNDKVLFTALTDPLEYRDASLDTSNSGGNPYNQQAGEQPMTAEQLAQEAERILKPIAPEDVRVMLAGHILRESVLPAERKKFRTWFTEPLPTNLLGQMRIYQACPPGPELLDQFEGYFTLYSGTAIARLLGTLPRTPDLALLGSKDSTNPLSKDLTGWGGADGGGSGEDNIREAMVIEYLRKRNKKVSPEEELVRLVQKIWEPEVASVVAKRVSENISSYTLPGYGESSGGKTTDEKHRLALACTMPLDSVRYALFKRCKSFYQQGPEAALGNAVNRQADNMDPVLTAAIKSQGGNGGGLTDTDLLAIDPGLLVVVKMMHRTDPNPNTTSTKPGNVAAHTGTAAVGENIQHKWFFASQQLVTQMFTQCLAAAAPSGGMGGVPIPAPAHGGGGSRSGGTTGATAGEVASDPSSVELHKGATIVTRLDFKLPGQIQGPLGKLPVDPLEVHYVRIEEMNNPQRVASHYRRAFKGQEHVLPNSMGWWFDNVDDGTSPGSRRSVDVVVSPGLPKPVNPQGGGRPVVKKGTFPIVVQILTIETANPTLER